MERERLLSRVGMQLTAPPDRSVQPKLPRGTARGGSPTAVQAWRPCPLWEPSPSHPVLV